MSSKAYNALKKLREKADKIWGDKYLGDVCEACGKSKYLLGHHFYWKKAYAFLRYCPTNHITLCKFCHWALHSGGDPKKIENKIINHNGIDWWLTLRKLSEDRVKVKASQGYYKEQITKLLG